MEARSLFEYGYAYLFPLVNVRTLQAEGLPVTFEGAVQKGDETVTVPAVVADVDAVVSMYLPARLALQASQKVRAQVAQPEVSVPVQAGDPAGEVSYYYEDRLLFTLPLVFQYGLEPDPTPTPAPVLQVEKRAQSSSGEAAAPVQEIGEASTADQGQRADNLLWYVLPPLWLLGCVFVIALLLRRKRK